MRRASGCRGRALLIRRLYCAAVLTCQLKRRHTHEDRVRGRFEYEDRCDHEERVCGLDSTRQRKRYTCKRYTCKRYTCALI